MGQAARRIWQSCLRHNRWRERVAVARWRTTAGQALSFGVFQKPPRPYDRRSIRNRSLQNPESEQYVAQNGRSNFIYGKLYQGRGPATEVDRGPGTSLLSIDVGN